MKTVKLTSQPPSAEDLLGMARSDVVLVTTVDGDSFVISTADEFDTAVQLLKRNHAFLSMLDALKAEKECVSLEEAEERLR